VRGEVRVGPRETASVSGRGALATTTSAAAIDAARHECVATVIDQIVLAQVVPFVSRLADRRVAAAEPAAAESSPRSRKRRRGSSGACLERSRPIGGPSDLLYLASDTAAPWGRCGVPTKPYWGY